MITNACTAKPTIAWKKNRLGSALTCSFGVTNAGRKLLPIVLPFIYVRTQYACAVLFLFSSMMSSIGGFGLSQHHHHHKIL